VVEAECHGRDYPPLPQPHPNDEQAGGHQPVPCLRHSTASYLLSRGMTLQDVKEQLGHSTIVLTSNTYGHLLDERRSGMARELEAVLGG
jgi:integrase